jgi:histidine ammonia-lyase
VKSDSVILESEPLSPADLLLVAGGARLELGDAARRRIQASRAVIDRHVAGQELVYGLNTGLGHWRDQRVPDEALRAQQPAIVAMHAGGLGPPLRTDIVRAAMAVRVAGMARGGSGASPALADTLLAMLNAGVHPIVPATGSVGAADLMHMAAIGLVAIGQGRAEYEGETLPGDEALRRAGIEPVALAPKDALTLISANGVAIGHAALVVARAEAAAQLADAVLATSLEAIRGNVSIVDPIVASAKPVAGQAESAATIRAMLEGSQRCLPGGAASVQDPLSFRVGPQVHGAMRETTRFLREQVAIELAAMDDNPLVDIDSGRLISNGNFHPMALALAADALRPAVAHVGQLSDRRLNHLWSSVAALVDPTDADLAARAGELSGLLMRYSSAVRYTELREIANPVTLDIPPLDLGVEDHATNAPLAVARSEQALGLLDDVLVVELLVAADVLRLADPDLAEVGAGVRLLLNELAAVRAEIGTSATSAELHAGVAAALYGRLLPAVQAPLPS